MLWTGSGLRGGTPWPQGWPGLDAPRTIKRGDSYSIFLAGSRLGALREFLEACEGRAEIGGTTWWIRYRFAFPSFTVYQEAFGALR